MKEGFIKKVRTTLLDFDQKARRLKQQGYEIKSVRPKPGHLPRLEVIALKRAPCAEGQRRWPAV